MIFRSEKSRLISTVLLRTCIKSDQRKLGLENLWPCSEEEKGDGCPGVGAAGAGSRDWRSAWASANGRHRHTGAAHAEGLDAGWPALAKAGLGCNGRWSYRHQRERNAEESRAEPQARPARTRQLGFPRAAADGREEAAPRGRRASGHQRGPVTSLSGRGHRGGARAARRRRRRPRRGRERRGRERERREGGSGSRRIWKENPKVAYIFGRLPPEQKPHDTARSREKADGSEWGVTEGAFGEIRSNQSWPDAGRSNGHEILERRGPCFSYWKQAAQEPFWSSGSHRMERSNEGKNSGDVDGVSFLESPRACLGKLKKCWDSLEVRVCQSIPPFKAPHIYFT